MTALMDALMSGPPAASHLEEISLPQIDVEGMKRVSEAVVAGSLPRLRRLRFGGWGTYGDEGLEVLSEAFKAGGGRKLEVLASMLIEMVRKASRPSCLPSWPGHVLASRS